MAFSEYPRLSERGQGWLRYLHRKATVADRWDRHGRPSDMWDDRSGAPMTSWHRFDLIDSSYAVAVAAEVTPAWRELYGTILDCLLERYASYWAAIDWLEQIGPDPRRDRYPAEWLPLIPRAHLGNYDVPGWTANGVEPWGLEMDPVAAQGNLFYTGFFDLLLGLHLSVTGDRKWNRPFEIVRDGEQAYSYTHGTLNQLLATQWERRPEGCHCENTKIWPY
ncbi:MAG: hypothetical protein ACRDV9_14115 [Acidimicrobiia bacterium]